jgi:hypothetical protein
VWEIRQEEDMEPSREVSALSLLTQQKIPSLWITTWTRQCEDEMSSYFAHNSNESKMVQIILMTTAIKWIVAVNRLLGSCAVYYWLEPTFRRNVSVFTASYVYFALANFSCFCPDREDGGDTFLRNVGSNQ